MLWMTYISTIILTLSPLEYCGEVCGPVCGDSTATTTVSGREKRRCACVPNEAKQSIVETAVRNADGGKRNADGGKVATQNHRSPPLEVRSVRHPKHISGFAGRARERVGMKFMLRFISVDDMRVTQQTHVRKA